MTIQSLVYNLKLLGFDGSRHGNGSIKVDKKLFSRGAINNDKALEYICLFLFRKIDSARVKEELLPILATQTRASRYGFITSVYKWLDEISRKTDLLKGISLRKSEFLTCHGVNLIKVMVAFSTYVLQHYKPHTGKLVPYTCIATILITAMLDAKKFSTLRKSAIQNSIIQENQSFNLSTETSNTYVSKAINAAREISTELSSSPPSPPSQHAIPMELRSIKCLNDHLGCILQNLYTMEQNSVNQESTVVEESLASASHDQSTTVRRSSSPPISFESLRTLEESSTSMPSRQPRTIEETPSPAIPEYPEATNEATNTVPAEYPLVAEKSPSPAIQDYPNTMSAPSSSLYADQPRSMQEPASSVYVEEPNAVITSPDTISVAAAAATSSVSIEAPYDNSSSAMENTYIPNGSRAITTPKYIPQPLTPDQQLGVPDLYHDVSRPKPPATMLHTSHTSFIPRDAIHHFPSPNVLAPIHFNYLTESRQLPHIRSNIMTHLWDPSLESPYWHLPPIVQADSHQPPIANAGSASPPSPCGKRSFEEDDEDSIVVPRSPPRQKRRTMYSDQDEAAMTPTSYDMDFVPPTHG